MNTLVLGFILGDFAVGLYTAAENFIMRIHHLFLRFYLRYFTHISQG